MLWLFDPASTGSANEWDSKGITATEAITAIANALDKLVDPNTTLRGITEIEDQARKLQKTMTGGMVLESGKFREQLMLSYAGVLKMGGSFQSITDAVGGIADGMGKVTFLTTDIVKTGEKIKMANGEMKDLTYTAAESMVSLAKSTNMAEKEVGGMVSNFIRLEGSQSKSLEKMQDLAKTARMSGLQSKKLLEEVQTNLKSVDSFNFKSGVDGLARMAAQAQILRTSIDSIGALTKAQDLWDPEKSIELAANLQTLGGSIGDLGNPFKLMNMGMNDVEELQNQMVDMAAKAFQINEKTGEIDISNTSRMRLKEQATLFGKTLEDFTKIGREAFKAKQVMQSAAETGFGEGMPKESKDLLASLTEFKGGKMTLDIPGFKTDDLEKAMTQSPEQLKKALEEYQKVADLSDRQIAEKGLTLQETSARDQRIIRDTLIMSLSKDQRQGIIDSYEKGLDVMAKNTQEATKQGADIVKEKVLGSGKEMENTGDGKLDPTDEANQRTYANTKEKTISGSRKKPPENDVAFSTGNKVLSLGKGEMFNFIKEDEAVFAPNLLKNLDILKKTYEDSFKIKNNFEGNRSLDNIKQMSSAPSSIKTESTQKIEASGDINININVNTSGTLSDALMKDRTFTQELKNRVMTIIKDKSKISVEKGQVR